MELSDELRDALKHVLAYAQGRDFHKCLIWCQRALDMLPPDDAPELWADINITYGDCLLNVGEQRQAINHYHQALSIYSGEHYQSKRSNIMPNLARAYVELSSQPITSENVDQLIEFSREALTLIDCTSVPLNCSQIRINLAAAHIVKGDQIEDAIGYLEEARIGLNPDRHSKELRILETNLAEAHIALAEQDSNSRMIHIDRAITSLRKALNFTEANEVEIKNRLLRDLGDMYFAIQNWQVAWAYYEQFLELSDKLLKNAYSEERRWNTLKGSGFVHANVTYCLVKLGRINEALAHLERGKTRLLTEALAVKRLDFDNLPPQYRQRLEILSARHSNFLQDYRQYGLSSEHHQQLETQAQEIHTAFISLWDEIQINHPKFRFTAITFAQVKEFLHEGYTLVLPCVTSQGSFCFILSRQTADSVTDADLVWLHDLTRQDIAQMILDLFPSYIDDVRLAANNKQSQGWRDTLEKVTKQLWDKFIESIRYRLNELNTQWVILIPEGGLHSLPIHAAWQESNGVKRFFIDEYHVAYAPSLKLLYQSLQLQSNCRFDNPVVAAVQAYSNSASLSYTRLEGIIIGKALNTEPLLDGEVTRKAVVERCLGASHIHLACHGNFMGTDMPLTAWLELAGNQRLTLNDIRSLSLKKTRLVVLSACETGMSDLLMLPPDEAMGMPTAFLYAGAGAVIGSLWVVNDCSTMLLMERFYRNYLNRKMKPIMALREAQLWLRSVTRRELSDYLKSLSAIFHDEAYAAFARIATGGAPEDKPFANPYFWAAFTITGI